MNTTSALSKVAKLIFIVTLNMSAPSAQADVPQILDSVKSPVTWNISTNAYQNMGYAYASFFMQPNETIRFFTAGGGLKPGNGIHELRSNMDGSAGMSERLVIGSGPDLAELNYFRGTRIAQDGNQMWMIVEVSRCYSGGCDLTGAVKRLAVYYSADSGTSWNFKGLMKVDGVLLDGDWMAHTGLVFDSHGDPQTNLVDPAKNKFITIGTQKNIFVSSDGVNYYSVPIATPFPKDRMVFASLAKTPFGFHIMTGADWSDATGVTTIRHLYSKDLKTWHALESASVLKNKLFYKGVHLYYDPNIQKLWAFSPCGSNNACGILAWLKPKDFLP